MTKTTLNAIIAALPTPAHLYGFKVIGGGQIILAPDIRPITDTTRYISYQIDDTTDCIVMQSHTMNPAGPQIRVMRYIDIGSIVEVLTFLPEAPVVDRNDYM
jgi:hypothetical protein